MKPWRGSPLETKEVGEDHWRPLNALRIGYATKNGGKKPPRNERQLAKQSNVKTPSVVRISKPSNVDKGREHEALEGESPGDQGGW